MKKYMKSLIPLVVCSALGLVYLLIHPQDYPHPSYPFRTKESLDFLSTGWFIIGAVGSAILFFYILLEDAFRKLERRHERRHLKK